MGLCHGIVVRKIQRIHSLAHLVTHVSCAQNRREWTHLTKDGEHSPLFVPPTSTMRD